MPVRVYLVEDSPILVSLLRDLLRDIGAVVIGNADASSTAIAEIAKLHPDVVTIDITLRKGSGFDVLRALATARDKPPLRIIFSNLTSDAYQREAESLGAEYFLDKARQMRELLQILERQP